MLQNSKSMKKPRSSNLCFCLKTRCHFYLSLIKVKRVDFNSKWPRGLARVWIFIANSRMLIELRNRVRELTILVGGCFFLSSGCGGEGWDHNVGYLYFQKVVIENGNEAC